MCSSKGMIGDVGSAGTAGSPGTVGSVGSKGQRGDGGEAGKEVNVKYGPKYFLEKIQTGENCSQIADRILFCNSVKVIAVFGKTNHGFCLFSSLL